MLATARFAGLADGFAGRGRTGLALGAAAAFALLLSACGTDYASSDPAFPGDVEARHPIVVATAPTILDVYPIGSALDARSVAELRAFGKRYQSLGSGELVILTPDRRNADARAVAEIRKTLRAAGVRSAIGAGSYAPIDRDRSAPIRVAFLGLKAEVKTPCGLWPDDLASGSSLQGWKNEPYANFGCATQAMLAAQVDDPRDFVQSRALAPSDVAMRTRAIEDVRRGADPGTAWVTGLTAIGGVGGN
jgi:pilus assembly protein CpaD